MIDLVKPAVLSVVVTCASMAFAADAHAAMTFTDRAAWEAAVLAASGTITTDTFSTDIASAQSITLDSGIVSTNSNEITLPNVFNNNSVSGGLYQNAVGAPSWTASTTITWTFPTPGVFAFGAEFLNVNVGGLTLNGDFDGTGLQSYILANEIGSSTGFFGVIGTATFGSVTYTQSVNGIDAFRIEDASFATQPAAAVPEPASVTMLVVGGVAAFGRRLRPRTA